MFWDDRKMMINDLVKLNGLVLFQTYWFFGVTNYRNGLVFKNPKWRIQDGGRKSVSFTQNLSL